VEARPAEAAALVGRSHTCPFDLHVLLPVRATLLQPGPTHPNAQAWLADHQPFEQHADRGEPLFHAWRGGLGLQRLDVAGHVMRPELRQCQTACLGPYQKAAGGARVGPPRVGVADVGGEELDIAPACLLTQIGNQGRDQMAVTPRAGTF